MGAKARAELEAARAKHGRPVPSGLGGKCVHCGAGNPAEEMTIRGGPRAGNYLVCRALPCGVMFAGEADFNQSFCGPRAPKGGSA